MDKMRSLTAEDVEDRRAERKRKNDAAEWQVEESRRRLKLQEDELELRKETNGIMRSVFDFMKLVHKSQSSNDQ